MSQPSAVAVIDPNAKFGLSRGKLLRNTPLSECRWPLGCPDRLQGKRVKDLAARDHLIGFAQNLDPRWPPWGVQASVSLVLAEPTAIHGSYQEQIVDSPARFHRILTYNRALLSRIPNGIFFPYGSTWVRDWKTRDMQKSKMCSLIASPKRSQAGHVLRHRVADWSVENGLDVALLGKGYARFEDKGDGLAPYRYSVVIENVREENYFSEKLVDAMLCDTVPIYWGCPNIGDFIDTDAMMVCESFEQIQSALRKMSQDDYAARQPQLKTAKAQAAQYADFFARAAMTVLEDRPHP